MPGTENRPQVVQALRLQGAGLLVLPELVQVSRQVVSGAEPLPVGLARPVLPVPDLLVDVVGLLESAQDPQVDGQIGGGELSVGRTSPYSWRMRREASRSTS